MDRWIVRIAQTAKLVHREGKKDRNKNRGRMREARRGTRKSNDERVEKMTQKIGVVNRRRKDF